VTFSGNVRHYLNLAPVAGVAVSDGDDIIFTDDDGNYALTVLPGKELALLPAKVDGGAAALGALDAVRILEVAVGRATLSAAGAIACDVSGNGTVSTLDASQLLRFLVGSEAALPVASVCGSEWAFLPIATESFGQSRTEPFIVDGVCTAGSLTYEPPLTASSDRDFLAIPFGDCDGSWNLVSESAFAAASSGDVPRAAMGPLHGTLRTLRFPVVIAAGTELNGLEATIAYDDSELEFVRIRPVGAMRAGLLAAHGGEGEIRLALATLDPVVASELASFVVHFRSRSRRAAEAYVAVERIVIDGREAAIEFRSR